MAYSSGQGINISLTASGDMNDNQYRFVNGASTGGQRGRFQLATGGSGPAPIGVLQNNPKNLEAGNIRTSAITQLAVNADTAINVNDFLTSNSVGHGVVTSTAGSNPYQAIALEDVASGSGVIIAALLENGTVQADNTP